jgi:nucleotide-binding universal stress UspA family protein
MKILIAADGSAYTQRMLEYLCDHAWLHAGHELTVLCVVLPLPHRAASLAGRDLAQSYYDEDAAQVLAPVREFMQARGIEASFVHRVGHPAECIARAATEGAYDLLVLGSHGHGTVSSLVLGSVVQKVLALCKTPALLIR